MLWLLIKVKISEIPCVLYLSGYTLLPDIKIVPMLEPYQNELIESHLQRLLTVVLVCSVFPHLKVPVILH